MATKQTLSTKAQVPFSSLDPIYQVWLVTEDGEIFVNRADTHLHIKDLTIETHCLDDLIQTVEDKWGILLEKDNLEYVYSFQKTDHHNHTRVDTYLIELNLTKEEKNIIVEKTHGTFVNIQQFEEMMSMGRMNYKLDHENFASLFAFLFERFQLFLN